MYLSAPCYRRLNTVFLLALYINLCSTHLCRRPPGALFFILICLLIPLDQPNSSIDSYNSNQHFFIFYAQSLTLNHIKSQFVSWCYFRTRFIPYAIPPLLSGPQGRSPNKLKMAPVYSSTLLFWSHIQLFNSSGSKLHPSIPRRPRSQHLFKQPGKLRVYYLTRFDFLLCITNSASVLNPSPAFLCSESASKDPELSYAETEHYKSKLCGDACR